MTWTAFPYPDPNYDYTPASLGKAWKLLHTGDAEPFPEEAAVVRAWVEFHAGRFEAAARQGLKLGTAGYAVAAKATCIHANYLEPSVTRQATLFDAVLARSEQQQACQPDNPAGYYWFAYALGRKAQRISVLQALAQGAGGRIRKSLETVLRLEPRHADAHIALGLFHAEIVSKVGALAARLSYGASKEAGLRHFAQALELNPGSAIARVEYANALAMLDGKRKLGQAIALCEQAAALLPHDAMERLDIELAKTELQG
jgi:tetratricopeptide (TPR) repeat protein